MLASVVLISNMTLLILLFAIKLLARPNILKKTKQIFLREISLFIIIELTHSKTILEITVEIEPQPATLDFKNLSQYSRRSK